MGPSGPNGVHVMIVWLVVLFKIRVTASERMADGIAHIIASTHMSKAVITVNGFVCEKGKKGAKKIRNQVTINNKKTQITKTIKNC